MVCRTKLLFLLLSLAACTEAQASGIADPAQLERQLGEIAAKSDGRVGVCAADQQGAIACVNGDQRFSLQSVMKLVVGAAVMDAVDHRGWNLADEVVIRREDLSLHVQPLADIVRAKGEFRTNIGDLVERAVTESDSAATDVLFARLGGEPAIAEFLLRNGVAEQIRVDRDERHLQTEISGVIWRSEFVDPEELARARAALNETQKARAFAAYLADERDSATPLGMATFLLKLSQGRVLSAASTEHFLGVMSRTRTFPNRLPAGAPPGWRVAHKTGTSADWKGQNGVTNDVGLMFAPDGGIIAVAAFLAGSRRPDEARAAAIAEIAHAVTEAYN